MGENYTTPPRRTIGENENDGDDSSCQTGTGTVRATNVRRVTVSLRATTRHVVGTFRS